MKTFTSEQLAEILARHKAWRIGEETGERANLSGADLSEVASWNGASGNLREVKSIQANIWPITYTSKHMQIGCQLHCITECWAFSDSEILRMDSQALAWWAVWKPILQTIIAESPAVPSAPEKVEGVE